MVRISKSGYSVFTQDSAEKFAHVIRIKKENTKEIKEEKKILNWCCEHVKKKSLEELNYGYFYKDIYFFFQTEKNAMFFRLVWGGEYIFRKNDNLFIYF